MKTNKIGLILHILIAIVLSIFLFLRRSDVNPIYFWIIYLALISTQVWIIFKEKRKTIILSLLIFAFTMLLIYKIQYPNTYNLNRDGLFEAQFSNSIVENSYWNPELGSGYAEDYYGYNPVLHFLLSLFSIVAKQSTYILGNFFFIAILDLLLILSIDYLITAFVDKNSKLPYIALFLFIVSPRLRMLALTRRLVGAIFMAISIGTFVRLFNKKIENSYYIIFVISSILTIISDHAMAYFYVGFILIWLIYTGVSNIITNNKSPKIKISKLMILSLIVLIILGTWQLFFANTLLTQDFYYMKSFIKAIFNRNFFDYIFNLTIKNTSPVRIINSSETLIALGSQVMTGILSFIGTILILLHYKKIKKISSSDKFLIFFSIFSLMFYPISLILINSAYGGFSMSYIWFPSVGLAISIAYLLFIFLDSNKNQFLKYILLLIIFIMFFTGGLFSSIQPTRFHRIASLDSTVLEFPENRMFQTVASGQWLSLNSIEAVAIGDHNIYDIYAGVFNIEMAKSNEAKQFYHTKMPIEINYLMDKKLYTIGSAKHSKRSKKINYFILNKNLFSYPSYLAGYPVDSSQEQIIDSADKAHRIYDNGKIIIYKAS